MKKERWMPTVGAMEATLRGIIASHPVGEDITGLDGRTLTKLYLERYHTPAGTPEAWQVRRDPRGGYGLTVLVGEVWYQPSIRSLAGGSQSDRSRFKDRLREACPAPPTLGRLCQDCGGAAEHMHHLEPGFDAIFEAWVVETGSTFELEERDTGDGVRRMVPHDVEIAFSDYHDSRAVFVPLCRPCHQKRHGKTEGSDP